MLASSEKTHVLENVHGSIVDRGCMENGDVPRPQRQAVQRKCHAWLLNNMQMSPERSNSAARRFGQRPQRWQHWRAEDEQWSGHQDEQQVLDHVGCNSAALKLS